LELEEHSAFDGKYKIGIDIIYCLLLNAQALTAAYAQHMLRAITGRQAQSPTFIRSLTWRAWARALGNPEQTGGYCYEQNISSR
jgi:hypothetical protein